MSLGFSIANSPTCTLHMYFYVIYIGARARAHKHCFVIYIFIIGFSSNFEWQQYSSQSQYIYIDYVDTRSAMPFTYYIYAWVWCECVKWAEVTCKHCKQTTNSNNTNIECIIFSHKSYFRWCSCRDRCHVCMLMIVIHTLLLLLLVWTERRMSYIYIYIYNTFNWLKLLELLIAAREKGSKKPLNGAPVISCNYCAKIRKKLNIKQNTIVALPHTRLWLACLFVLLLPLHQIIPKLYLAFIYAYSILFRRRNLFWFWI